MFPGANSIITLVASQRQSLEMHVDQNTDIDMPVIVHLIVTIIVILKARDQHCFWRKFLA